MPTVGGGNLEEEPVSPSTPAGVLGSASRYPSGALEIVFAVP